MECPFCHYHFDEILEVTDGHGNVVVAGCRLCLEQRNLVTSLAVESTA